jgi:hypothetical protein
MIQNNNLQFEESLTPCHQVLLSGNWLILIYTYKTVVPYIKIRTDIKMSRFSIAKQQVFVTLVQ